MDVQKAPSADRAEEPPSPGPPGESNITEQPIYKVFNVLLWCLALALPCGLYFYFVRSQPGVALSDFHIFYQAALVVREGKDPFQPALAALHVIQQNPGAATGGYFLYPVPFLLLFIPLTFVPFNVAALIWTALSILLLVFTIKLLAQIWQAEKWSMIVPILVICFSFMGITRNELKLGQVDILITFLITANYYAYSKKHPVVSGITLSLAVIIKPYLGLLLFYYLWKRAYRVVASFVVASLIFFGAAIILAGWQENIEWIQVARLVASIPRVSQVAVVSLYSLLLRLFTVTLSAKPWVDLGVWPAYLGAILLGVVVALVALRAVKRSHRDPQTSALEFALWLAGSLLIFPGLEDIHAMPAVIVLTIVLLSLPWKQVMQNISLPVTFYALAVLLYFLNPFLPTWQWVGDAPLVTGWSILGTGAYFLGLILLFCCTLQVLSMRSASLAMNAP